MQGVRLLLLHPAIAGRDCAHCQEWLYDEKTGKVTERGGKPVRRPHGSLPPCRYIGVGCPKGTPEESRALSDKNLRAYQHYRECVAVGEFPDDAIVRRNAGLIRMVEDSIKSEKQDALLAGLGLLQPYLKASG